MSTKTEKAAKVEITEEEFIKKVEIEYSFLVEMEYVKKKEARQIAEKYVGEHFTIKKK